MKPSEQAPVILVIADVEETRKGIARLLRADGYRVLAATVAADAVGISRGLSPDLVLLALHKDLLDPAFLATQIRTTWSLADDVPIVVFAVTTLAEGAETKIESNIYLTRPDNFNQLRKLISRLLRRPEREV